MPRLSRSWLRLTALTAVLTLFTGGFAAAAPAAGTKAPTPGTASLYVSDYADNSVLKRPVSGGPQETVPTTGLTRPTYMAFDAQGDLYISDTVNSRIVKIPADGGPQETVPGTDLLRPLGLAVNAAGDLFIADSFNDRVVKIPADGGPQETVPTSGLLHPAGLALDANGDLYIADFVNDRVVKVPAGGGPQTTVPTTGLSQPTGLALHAGGLYISDSGNDRVVRVPTSGGPQTTVPATGLKSPQGLAFDSSGNLYIADFGNDRVVRVPAGGAQTVVPFTGLTTPVGLAVSAPDAQRAKTRLEARTATVSRWFHPPTLKVKGLSATLTRSDGTPVAGQTVKFSNTTKTRQLCEAVTNSQGVARCDATVRDRVSKVNRLYDDLRRHGYRAAFAGSTTFKASTDTARVRPVH